MINLYHVLIFFFLFFFFIWLQLGEYTFEHGYYWEMLGKQIFENCDPNFHRLKRLLVNGFKFEKLELEMLKCILNNAGVLESVTLVPAKKWLSANFSGEQHTYDQLFESWKVSPSAKIHILKSIKLVKFWSF